MGIVDIVEQFSDALSGRRQFDTPMIFGFASVPWGEESKIKEMKETTWVDSVSPCIDSVTAFHTFEMI